MYLSVLETDGPCLFLAQREQMESVAACDVGWARPGCH